MASAWGESWGSAWGESWGVEVPVPPPTPGGGMGGSAGRAGRPSKYGRKRRDPKDPLYDRLRDDGWSDSEAKRIMAARLGEEKEAKPVVKRAAKAVRKLLSPSLTPAQQVRALRDYYRVVQEHVGAPAPAQVVQIKPYEAESLAWQEVARSVGHPIRTPPSLQEIIAEEEELLLEGIL